MQTSLLGTNARPLLPEDKRGRRGDHDDPELKHGALQLPSEAAIMLFGPLLCQVARDRRKERSTYGSMFRSTSLGAAARQHEAMCRQFDDVR